MKIASLGTDNVMTKIESLQIVFNFAYCGLDFIIRLSTLGFLLLLLYLPLLHSMQIRNSPFKKVEKDGAYRITIFLSSLRGFSTPSAALLGSCW